MSEAEGTTTNGIEATRAEQGRQQDPIDGYLRLLEAMRVAKIVDRGHERVVVWRWSSIARAATR